MIWVIPALYIIYCLTNPLVNFPGPLMSIFAPCLVSPWAIAGKLASRVREVAFSYSQFGIIRTGWNKVGVLKADLARNILLNKHFQKIPTLADGNDMIRYGLPFISDPDLARSLRSVTFKTSLNRQSLIQSGQMDLVNKFLNRIPLTPFDPETIISDFTLENVLAVILNLDDYDDLRLPQLQTGLAAGYRMLTALSGNSIVWRNMLWLYCLFYGQPGIQHDQPEIEKFLDKVIEKNPSIVQEMIAQGFSNKQIRCHVTSLFQAGTDTTSFAIKTGLILLARHPNLQEELYSKLKLIPHIDYSLITTEVPEMIQLTYAVLNYLTPIPILRGRVGPEVKLDEYRIPKGVNIGFPIDFIMQPQTERVFSLDDAKAKNLSFGDGDRVCPGNTLAKIQMTILFAGVLKRFKLIDLQPEIDLDSNCRSFITRFWLKGHQLQFILRE